MFHKILSTTITKIKGNTYTIDKDIPITYILLLLARRSAMLLNGFFIFGKTKIFIASSVKIRCKNKIQTSKGLSVDRACYIDALSKSGIKFGENVSVGKYTTIECTGSIQNIGIGLKVGNNVGLGSHGFFGCAGGVEIGDDTILGNYVSIHSENHNYSNTDIPIRLQGVNRKGIKIGKDCWIGAKVTILDGTVLGDGCVVAAGAVVRGEIPPFSIIGGVPAKIIKQRSSK